MKYNLSFSPSHSPQFKCSVVIHRIGQSRFRTFPSAKKVLLDNTGGLFILMVISLLDQVSDQNELAVRDSLGGPHVCVYLCVHTCVCTGICVRMADRPAAQPSGLPDGLIDTHRLQDWTGVKSENERPPRGPNLPHV